MRGGSAELRRRNVRGWAASRKACGTGASGDGDGVADFAEPLVGEGTGVDGLFRDADAERAHVRYLRRMRGAHTVLARGCSWRMGRRRKCNVQGRGGLP
jgi:hypothetical protein